MIKKLLLILLLIATPLWAETEIYFTGQDNVEAKVIEKIGEAENEILIAMYSFTNPKLLDALNKAQDRNIKGKIILDKVQSAGTYALTDSIHDDLGIYWWGINYINKPSHAHYLKGHWEGAIMRGFSGGIMHNKTCIIDDKYLITGSYNWTESAEKRNYENLVIIDDPKIIKQATEYYNKLWEK